MCIDIEYDLKVMLVNDVESHSAEDGYDIVDGFLGKYPYIVDKIAYTILFSICKHYDEMKLYYFVIVFDVVPIFKNPSAQSI